MSNAESNNPDTGFDAAVSNIADLLGPDDGNPGHEDEQQQVAEQDEREPSDAPEEEGADESEQDESEGTDEEQGDENQATDTLEELEIDGKKFKVPAELKPYVLRQQDYTRKTQELAEQRKFVEAKFTETQTLHQQYANGLQVLQQFVQKSMPQLPDPRLKHEDLVSYLDAKDEYDRTLQERTQQLHGLQGEMMRLAQLQKQQEEQLNHQRLMQEAKALPELIPVWRDEKRREADQVLIRESLKSKGVTDEEIAHISRYGSAVQIAILQEWASLKRLAEKRATAKPVATKTVQPGPSRKPTSESARTKAFARARQTGRLEDAAAAIANILED